MTVGEVCEYSVVEWEDCDWGKCVSTEWWSGKSGSSGRCEVHFQAIKEINMCKCIHTS